MESTIPTTRLITGEELAHRPDLNPCELVEGKVIPMSPTNWKHGYYVSELTGHLLRFVKKHKLGSVLTGEVGIYVRRAPDTIRAADVAFISHKRLAQVQSESYLDVAPEVVVEVISPGNSWQEMRQKMEEYFGIGVEWVWIVEPEPEQVLVYHTPTDLKAVPKDDVLRGEGVLDGFALPLADLFSD